MGFRDNYVTSSNYRTPMKSVEYVKHKSLLMSTPNKRIRIVNDSKLGKEKNSNSLFKVNYITLIIKNLSMDLTLKEIFQLNCGRFRESSSYKFQQDDNSL